MLLQDRKREWKRALENLADAVDASTERGAEIDYVAMNVFHQGIKRLVTDAGSARRGLFGRSELNDTLKQLGTELISEIEKCKVELHVKEVEKGEQRGAQKQEDQIKQLQETIIAEKVGRSKDKDEMEEKLRKQEENAKEQTEKLKKNIEGELKEQKTQLIEQEEKINQLLQWMERGLASSAANQPKEPTAQEKSTQEEPYLFFKR